jgi:hypothetical protein
MTQGIVSLIVNGGIRYKIIAAHDGDNAKNFAAGIREHITKTGKIPSTQTLFDIVDRCTFGARETTVILEMDPSESIAPVIHSLDYDFTEETRKRYLDTAYDPQFNPRWEIGLADHVEVVDVRL